MSLSKALKQLLRSIDLLFFGDKPGRSIILMPNTPLVNARVVGGKIVQLVGSRGGVVFSGSGSLPVGLGVSAFGESSNAPERILEMALAELNAKQS